MQEQPHDAAPSPLSKALAEEMPEEGSLQNQITLSPPYSGIFRFNSVLIQDSSFPTSVLQNESLRKATNG